MATKLANQMLHLAFTFGVDVSIFKTPALFYFFTVNNMVLGKKIDGIAA